MGIPTDRSSKLGISKRNTHPQKVFSFLKTCTTICRNSLLYDCESTVEIKLWNPFAKSIYSRQRSTAQIPYIMAVNTFWWFRELLLLWLHTFPGVAYRTTSKPPLATKYSSNSIATAMMNHSSLFLYMDGTKEDEQQCLV